MKKLRVGLIHLREHKFKHSLQVTLNPLYECGSETERTSQYLTTKMKELAS